MARTEGRVENPKGMASPKEKWVLTSLGDKTAAFVCRFSILSGSILTLVVFQSLYVIQLSKYE